MVINAADNRNFQEKICENLEFVKKNGCITCYPDGHFLSLGCKDTEIAVRYISAQILNSFRNVIMTVFLLMTRKPRYNKPDMKEVMACEEEIAHYVK